MNEPQINDSPHPKRHPDPLAVLSLIICLGSAMLLLHYNKVGLWLLLIVSSGLSFRALRDVPFGRNLRWIVIVAALLPVMTKSVHFARLRLEWMRDETRIVKLVAQEQQILTLTTNLQAMAKGLMNLQLPDPANRGQFLDAVRITDLGPESSLKSDHAERSGFTTITWELAQSPPQPQAGPPDLWRPLLDRIGYFRHATFRILTGRFLDSHYQHFQGTVSFTAVARLKSGDWCELQGDLVVGWQRLPDQEQRQNNPAWRIDQWETSRMRMTTTPELIFREVLDQALPKVTHDDPARISLHQQAAVEYYQSGATNLPHPYFTPISGNQKPGLAVVDIDNDGFDDLYVTVRLGRNLLLHNQRDGTFVEAAARYGLDISGHTTCALFADFDNDGDLDAIMGRSIQRSLYLENKEGKYEVSSTNVPWPFLVTSLSAADYDGDGLLDVYVGTCRPNLPSMIGPGGGDGMQMSRWPDYLLDAQSSREYYRRYYASLAQTGAAIPIGLDQVGPPNLLLRNQGQGQFAVAPENAQVQGWRNTSQAAWADFDQDGDADLYVANDWGPDHLYRNDGAEGFSEITDQAGLGGYGLSAGVTWGDYNNDGQVDLYVSGVSSAAGRRIVSQVEELSPEFAQAVSGSRLFRQTESHHFEAVTGEPVAESGWARGGQFADFDQDGFLDLFVPGGYFTAPPVVASGLDVEGDFWRLAIRADRSLKRESFRQSPGWTKNAVTGENRPEVDHRWDAGLAENRPLSAHSLGGENRNRFYHNHQGLNFRDISGLSGMDELADGRAFVVWDYDRDGWPDVAVVNANEPRLQLFHNNLGANSPTNTPGDPVPGLLALRLKGGNRTSTPSAMSNRDGYGAVVIVDLGDRTLVRERQCGGGFGAPNSATMLLGLGSQDSASQVTVRWPSGASSQIQAVPAGTLLTVYENPEDSPTHDSFVLEPYRHASPSRSPSASRPSVRPRFSLTEAAPPPDGRIQVYLTMSTACEDCTNALPSLRHVVSLLSPEGVSFTGLPSDERDDEESLRAFATQWNPPYRLRTDLSSAQKQIVRSYLQLIRGSESPNAPAAIITDRDGRILLLGSGIPTVSDIRKVLIERETNP